MKNKVKTISKYTCNILSFANLLLIGLAKVWGWNIDKVSASIIVITGLCGAYLTTGKIFETQQVDELQTQEEAFKDMED